MRLLRAMRLQKNGPCVPWPRSPMRCRYTARNRDKQRPIAASRSNRSVHAGAILRAMPTTAAPTHRPMPTVVLVHGGWVDGSSWGDVIARLQATGLRVVSVQNPLTSLEDDVASVSRAIAMQASSVILVGHAWGGTVITQAGASDQVAALVYVAAFAPDRGESTNDLLGRFPPPGYAALLLVDGHGSLFFPQDALPNWFAQDLPAVNARVLAATQVPMRAGAFDDRVSKVAWQLKPSWYLVAEDDRMIAPQLQHEMAARIDAHVMAIHASHVPFLSRPKETASLVLDAVDAVRRG